MANLGHSVATHSRVENRLNHGPPEPTKLTLPTRKTWPDPTQPEECSQYQPNWIEKRNTNLDFILTSLRRIGPVHWCTESSTQWRQISTWVAWCTRLVHCCTRPLMQRRLLHVFGGLVHLFHLGRTICSWRVEMSGALDHFSVHWTHWVQWLVPVPTATWRGSWRYEVW